VLLIHRPASPPGKRIATTQTYEKETANILFYHSQPAVPVDLHPASCPRRNLLGGDRKDFPRCGCQNAGSDTAYDTRGWYPAGEAVGKAQRKFKLQTSLTHQIPSFNRGAIERLEFCVRVCFNFRI
jgi:hypothetical protein